MEALQVLTVAAESSRLIQGISLPNNEQSLSHLSYVDDAIFVAEDSMSTKMNLARILACFNVISGLKLNFYFYKSKVKHLTLIKIYF